MNNDRSLFYRNLRKGNSRDNNWRTLDIIEACDLVAYVFMVTGEMIIEAGIVETNDQGIGPISQQ